MKNKQSTINLEKKLTILIIFLIVINIILSAWFVINNDLLFHTDIGRDFLLFEEIVKTKKLTLIGPRSGGIPGVFHGPLWLYLNIPAFIIGNGNPVVIGWFWVALSVLTIGITYLSGKLIFNSFVGLLAALLVSTRLVDSTRALFNPFGAVLLAPLFFLFFLKYLKEKKIIYLVTSFFIIGLIIQFQIAFGLPILLISSLVLLKEWLKTKKWSHLLSYFILVIPLSSYAIFELRHNFLQVTAIFTYIFARPNEAGKMKIVPLILSRIHGVLIEGFNLLNNNYWFLAIIPLVLMLFCYFRKAELIKKYILVFNLFFFFYLGFWLIMLSFKGVVWSYYYWPFLGLSAILFSSLILFLNKYLFAIIFSLFILLNTLSNIDLVKGSKNLIGLDGGSWKFNYQMTKNIFDKANGEFGYFVYSPDLFGYPQKYAINYVQKEYSKILSFPYEKKRQTFLIIVPAPKDKPFLDGAWWVKNQVKISGKPKSIQKYTNGFRIEEYQLSEAEIKISADPNLVEDLHFR